MSETNLKGMAAVDHYYANYGARARELREQGERFFGYICSLVPVELISAAGFVPFRLRGDVHEPITKGNALLETIACPFMRSCFDLSVKGRYDFLEGIIIPHACDSITRTYSVWRYSLGLPYSHFINVPHSVNDASIEFFTAELNTFRVSLERYAGRAVTDHDLARAIERYAEYRTKVKKLYELRKAHPPIVSGTETAKILTVSMSLPVDEASVLLDEVLAELQARKQPSVTKPARIMVDGACIDNIDLIQLIEDSGAAVVTDSLCVGTRDHWPMVETGTSPLAALSRRYLADLNCPRTYREKTGSTNEEDFQARFGDAGSLARDFNVDGVILYVYKYCDPFGFEVPARKAYFNSRNLPILYLEDEYSAGTISRLRTRIQAFLEMIG
ncbi:MAG TPA: 2-hydroxyacyl-CoA dehydratase family protein [Thermodesulfobacteriota bacterium]|nr:2-hydroxyacyl-CoA dehydratase family protein [Thermodesulfobacteriota bacterium]